MARKRFDDMNCAAAQALEQIGDWWTLLIVREAFYGTATFSEFQERLGIAKNILTERLGALVHHGIFTREQVRPDVERHAYRLAAKGEALLPVLVALMQWGDAWVFRGEGPLKILDRERKEPIRKIKVEASNGRPLSIADLRFRPGAGANEQTLSRFRRRGSSKDGA